MSIETRFDISFIAAMALREKQIQQNYRPIIAVHKWFARRPGTLFRGLALAEFGTEPLREIFFRANDFPGKRVCDPFMGGGTPLLEANRIGCDVLGFDINPMAAWIVREEIEHINLGTYRSAAASMLASLTAEIGPLYRTSCPRYGDADVPVKYALWVKMIDCAKCGTTVISEVASEPELKNFIRHYWTATHGMTRERELYDAIKKGINSKAKAVDFAKSLAKASTFYAGLSNPASDQWNDYQPVVRQSIEVLEQLGVTQLRPLVLAIFQHFGPDEIAKALPMIVAWTVRVLICGSGGSGTLETAYAERAKEVSGAKIKTAAALWNAMKAIVPDDITFKSKFATATVSKAELAKYYLRVIELQSKSPDDETIVNPDQGKVNLEHILPRNPAQGWTHIPPAQVPALIKRLGNLTLLATRLNSKAANASFAEKRSTSQSPPSP